MQAEQDGVYIGNLQTQERSIGAIVARWPPLVSLERGCGLRTPFSACCYGTHDIVLERKESLGR
jgi:hypothetical protein